MRRFTTIAVLATALGGAGASTAVADTAAPRTITVSGDDQLQVGNDLATVSVGVSLRRPTSRAALNATSARIRRILAAAAAQGVTRADAQTNALELQRMHIRSHGRSAYRFTATQGVTLTIRDVKKVGEVVAGAAAGGASTIDTPSFTLADPHAAYRRALTAAFDEAKAKAQALADRAGATLGPVQSISESAQTAGSGGDPQRTAAGSPATPVKAVPPPVRAGQSEVDATVTVVFALQ